MSENKKETKAEKTETPKLRKPVLTILGVLSKAKGPMTRQAIAEKAGYSSSVGVYSEVGWPDEKKRKAADKTRPCLLTLGWVKQTELDIEGRKELGIEITPSGRKALGKA